MNLPHDVGASLREAFFMFWETLWPLVLGFSLSGLVQAFVSKQRMERAMGDHRAPAVLRSSGYGMVSSSCSYAATAMARSLFDKGADFVTAMVFMVASTNLVVELGIVLVVLLGWQFAVAEFIGGPIMIALLAAGAGLLLSRRVTDPLRRRIAEPPAGAGTRARLGDAAGFAVADAKMLRRELLIGYVVAGFLAVLVPAHVWSEVFVRGHGVWTTLENALVAPLVAVISFVCSIGNVPLAAALWKGGISFGGVVSFVFADLITFPLLLVYRSYYGTRVALRMSAVLWAAMTAAGLAVQGLFAASGLEPRSRPAHLVTEHFSWGPTALLNVAFLALAAVVLWLARTARGERFRAVT